jgi:Rho GTPase-activating protein 19
MIDDEDFVDSSEDEMEDDDNDKEHRIDLIQFPLDQMEHKTILPEGNVAAKKPFLFKSRLVKGLSLGNLMSSFQSPSRSPIIKKSKSSSIINDIEKDDEKRKLLMKNVTESFESSGESDLYFSMDHTKESWHVDDVSNINYFLNQTGMQEQHQVRNSMSPITKSTQRMPKSMQESIMTPRSRKPVMITMFGNNSSDPKAFQTNISQLLEESEEVPSESPHTSGSKESSSSGGSSIPLLMNTDDIAAANDNGLPTVDEAENQSGLSSAFK